MARQFPGSRARGARMPLRVRAAALAAVLCCMAAEGTAGDPQSQIEKDVWIPLLAASSAFDAEAFLALQSRDLVRVSTASGEVYGLERYAREIREGFARAKARGVSRTSTLRFLTRIASGDLAHETGYFRSETKLAGGDTRVRFTRFEFVLRRERGRWRILLDKDAPEGTEEEFQAAAPMKGRS